jgi:phage gpG-like protein
MSTIQSNIGLTLTVDVDLSGTRQFFDSLKYSLQDVSGGIMGTAFSEAGDSYMRGVQSRFDTFKHGGGDWPPLSPKYAARKMKKLGYATLLFYTGDLNLSLYPGQLNNVKLPLPDGIVVGTDDPKAHFHQYGTRKMPARPILVQPDDPSMPPTTLDDMKFDLEKGLQAQIDAIASNL